MNAGPLRDQWHKWHGNVGRLASHPVTLTAGVGVLVAALNVWWVHEMRDLGAYNVDEVGYVATALRYHSALDLFHPLEFLKAVGAPSSTGPLVPLLAVPLIALLGRGVPVVMLIQPLIVVVAAIGIAGVTTAAAGRRTGTIAGIVTLCMPGMVQSARGFQYGSAAAAFLALAVWALLRSDHGRSRWAMLAFGLSTGLMLLSRTMAVGFVPALAVAVVLQVRRDRRGWANVGLAALVTILVAGPWWVLSRNALYDYLVGFGYGRSSQYYGDAGLRDRVVTRWSNVAGDLRALRWIGLATGLAALATIASRWLRHPIAEQNTEPFTWRPHQSDRFRTFFDHPLTTVGAVVAIGTFTLLSTRNHGVWFELPLEALLVALVVGITAYLSPVLKAVIQASAVVIAVAAFAVSLTDSGGQTGFEATRSALQQSQLALYGGLIDKERPLSDADPALGSDDPTVRSTAAERWWQANIEVADAIERERRRTDNRLFVSVSGNSHLMNGQSLLLTQELRSIPLPPSEVPDTSASDEELRHHLDPKWNGTHERLLVLIRSKSQPFPEDRQVPRFEAMAEDAGWTRTTTIALPDGGDVVLMVPPS